MVIHAEKGPLMIASNPVRPPSTEELSQVRSLNRLFLGFLKDRVRRNEDGLGLPAEARAALLKASEEQLDAVAHFPRAVFALALEGEPARVMDLSAADSARFAIDITILHCAWSFSRQNVCQARFLLGLDSRTIQRLRALQLADLAQYARLPELLSCAFADNPRFWTGLLTVRQPEERWRLALIALQPATVGPPARAAAGGRSLSARSRSTQSIE